MGVTNHELSIILRLKDKASKVTNKVKENLKSFAAGFKKNWLAITAAIMAAVMALKKAFELVELGAQAKQIEESFGRMATAVGEDAMAIKGAMMEAAAGTINFSNVAGSVSALMAQGLGGKEVVALMRQARAEAILFGTTTEAAFNNVASAITGGLVTTLRRQFGLQLSLEAATVNYAKANNLSEDAVRKNYLAQAIANEILAKGSSHLNAVNMELVTEYERVQQVKAEWLSFKEATGQAIIKVMLTFKSFSELVGLQIAVIQSRFELFGAMFFEVIAKIQRAFAGLVGMMGKVANAPLFKNTKMAGELREFVTAVQTGATDAASHFEEKAALMRESAENLGQAIADARAEIDEFQAAVLGQTENIVDEETEAKIGALLLSAQEEMKKAAETMGEATGAAKDKTIEDFGLIGQAANDLTTAMSSSFADFFYKTFTGQLQSAREVFAEFGKSIIRIISEMIARWLVFMVLLKAMQAIGGPIGAFAGALSTAGGIPGGGGGAVPAAGKAKGGPVPLMAHGGEYVVNASAASQNRALLDRINKGGSGGAEGQSISNVFVINATDADSFKSKIQEHSEIIEGIFQRAIRRNSGPMRDAVRLA